MPSSLHEILLLLFRYRPSMAPDLLQAVLQVPMPEYAELQVVESTLTNVQPPEYRADLVILLHNRNKPVLGIVVEAQLFVTGHKRFAWPAYVTNLRARERCPVCLLVFAANKTVARWAARPIVLGGSNTFTPLVIGPAGVPVITDAARARAEPELAVLSTIAHGRDADSRLAAQIAVAAIAASVGLDPERSVLYFDVIISHLSEAARASLQAMDPSTYEYQSEFAKRYLSQGRSEGRSEGEIMLLSRQLTLKFGPLDNATTERLRGAAPADLERWAERILTATSLDELFR